jgi:hypothetical protein
VRLALLMAFGVIALGVGVFVALAYVERPEDAIYGGDGGREYTLRCPPGTVVVGADVHVRGAYLSGMSPLCLAPDAEAGADPRPLRLVGEAREVAQRIRCPEGDVAVGVSGGAGVVVDRLLFLCGPAGDPTRRASNTRAAGGSGGRSFSARCRDGALLGLRGRSGANLDSVGTLCDPLTSR